MPAKRPPRIPVLIVDEHRALAEALALAIEKQGEFDADVASSHEILDLTDPENPRVVLVSLDRADEVPLIRQIKERQPESRVVVLSSADDDLTRAKAVEAGAVGYVTNITPLEELPELLRRASRGESLLEDEEAERLLRYLRHRRHQESTERQRANRLTPRQIEILQLMADGVPVQEIAKQLNMSPYTLRTHVQNILTRLGVHTKLEALAVAIRHGKISTRG
ncbi:MAG TPA: response regulator transcription factor [Actinomycetota bacterium]|nr:response regulator transcription factor [Actinomycetota bacterium]